MCFPNGKNEEINTASKIPCFGKHPQPDEINIARSNIQIQNFGRQIIYGSGAARLRAEAGAIRIKGEWVKRGEGRGGGGIRLRTQEETPEFGSRRTE